MDSFRTNHISVFDRATAVHATIREIGTADPIHRSIDVSGVAVRDRHGVGGSSIAAATIGSDCAFLKAGFILGLNANFFISAFITHERTQLFQKSLEALQGND